MLAKSKIKTSKNVLQNRSTFATINFATLAAAEKNAVKYSKMLGQKITPVEKIANGGVIAYELLAENQIS